MRRYTFYLSVALLSFGIGSFVVFKLYWKINEFSVSNENDLANNVAVVNPIYNSEDLLLKSNKKNGKTEFVCNDKEIQPVWNMIMKDKYFPEHLQNSGRKIDCGEELVRKTSNFDINGNGIKEIVIQGIWGKDFCGMYSGCWFGVFEQTSQGYKSIYTYLNVAEFELGKDKSFGYQDLVLHSNGGLYGEYISILRFDGKKYKPKKCFIKTFDYFDANGQRQRGSKLRTESIDCASDL